MLQSGDLINGHLYLKYEAALEKFWATGRYEGNNVH